MREKRFALFVALLTLALPAAAIAQEASNAIEKMMPADALVFIQIKDFTGLSKAFDETLVAKTINESEMLDAARDALIDIARFGCAYAMDITYNDLKEVIGKNVGIAVFEGTDPRATAPVVVAVDISGTKEKFQSLLNEKIKPKLTSIGGAEALGQTTIGDKTVESLKLPKGKTVYFAIIGDVFAFGTLDGMKKLMADDAPRLAESPGYKTVKGAVDIPSGVTAYLNVEVLWGRFETEWQFAPTEKAELDALGVTAIQAIGASTKFEGQGMRDKLFVYTGPERTGILNHFASEPPQAPKSDALVPKEYALYARLLTGGGTKLWEAFKDLLRQTEGEQAITGIEQMRLVIQQQAMLDVEQDIIAQFGNEAFVAVDLSALTLGRKPRFTDFNFIVGMEVSDPVRLQGSIAQLFYAPMLMDQGIALDSFDYNGTTVYVVGLPRAPMLRPSYAFVEGFFVFSFKTESIQQVIDTVKAGTPLAKSEDYKAVMAKLSTQSNLSAYLDMGSLARGLVAALGPKAPPTAKPFIPVLAALSEKLTGMGVTAKGVDNGIVLESQSPIGGPTFVLALASAIELAKPTDQRNVETAQKRLAKVAKALEQYKRRNGVYPASLAELTPKPLKYLPLDPFAKDGRTLQYISTTRPAPAPAAPGAGGQVAQPQPPPAAGPSMFMLWSIGPDGKQDISPDEMSIEQWKAKATSKAPADIEFLKAKVWQYEKKKYPDEQDIYDEGDMVKGSGK
ncbi:MAG: DUF3352 domain-containing protein [Planctomycetes bacterium]|nr:DUF3352 domain-containing protein [Planctomycetota bacterium]